LVLLRRAGPVPGRQGQSVRAGAAGASAGVLIRVHPEKEIRLLLGV